jgi:hypothetical protein
MPPPGASRRHRQLSDVESCLLGRFPSSEKHQSMPPRAPPELPAGQPPVAAVQDSGRIPPPPTAVSSSPQPSRAPLPIPHRARTPRSPERRRFGRIGPRPPPLVCSSPEKEEGPSSFAFRPLEDHVILIPFLVSCKSCRKPPRSIRSLQPSPTRHLL